MGSVILPGSPIGNDLQQLLMADAIVPGEQPSYELCKILYTSLPIGKKMVDAPIQMAQSQEREITVPDSPEDEVVEQFKRQWKADNWDKNILNTRRLSRVYGIASIAVLVDGLKTSEPLPIDDIWKRNISFNVFDPLNTAGSLVLNQNPNAMDFQATSNISVGGQVYHRSRSCIILNEDPIYIDFTSSAFGFVGRSVYQRALFPLKSYVNTMITDDMVSRKVGVLIAKLKQPGSIIDNIMQSVAGIKRAILKEARTDNVINISTEEDIESLNLQNLDRPYELVRRNIIQNIAAADDMPAKILLEETFAEGFGEGTEDAKYVARYIDRERIAMKPLYDYADMINQRRAWNPEFYKTMQARYSRYEDIPFNQAFYQWSNSYSAIWPSLLKEPPSEEVKVADVTFRAAAAFAEILLPLLDPVNKALTVQWLVDNINENKLLFPDSLSIELDELEDHFQKLGDQSDDQAEAAMKEPKPPRPFADSMLSYRDAVGELVSIADRAKARHRLTDQRKK